MFESLISNIPRILEFMLAKELLKHITHITPIAAWLEGGLKEVYLEFKKLDEAITYLEHNRIYLKAKNLAKIVDRKKLFDELKWVKRIYPL